MPSVARVTISGRIFGQVTNNVLHFAKLEAVSSDVPILLGFVRDAWCNNPFALNTDGHYKVENIHGYIYGDTHVPIDLPLSLPGVGGPSNNGIPFVSAVFQIRTLTAGRHGRGRWYQPGFGQHQYSSGLWDGTAMVTLNACAAQIVAMWKHGTGAVYAASGWYLGVCRRNHPEDFIEMDTVVARSMVGYIGKRQLSRGE